MDEELIRLGLVDDDAIILDEAALALAALDHTEVDLAPYHRLLATFTTRLKEDGDEAGTAAVQAGLLARLFGDELGFAGDRETYDDPANADLIRVLDRRHGLPVSLSILYVAAARRLGWAADILDVPGHVLVLIGGTADPVIVDPFGGGGVVESARLAAMLATADPTSTRRQIAAMPNRAVLVRLLLNQATRAEQAGKGSRALELYRRMTVMAPEFGHAWWQRARLELVDGDVAAARQSLTALLEVTREPGLRARVVETLAALVAT